MCMMYPRPCCAKIPLLVRFAALRFMLPLGFLRYPWEDLDMLMAANEEGGISGMGEIEQLSPEGILMNIRLPTSSTNEGSTNTTDLAAANYRLLQMASFALSIWLQELLASLWILGYSQISCFKWIQVLLPAISTEISRSFGATPWRCSFTPTLNVVGWSIWWP